MAGKYLDQVVIYFDSFFNYLNLCCRTFWRHFLFPSTHKPDGDGMTFQTIYTLAPNNWP